MLISIIFSALLWFSVFFLIPCPSLADALFSGAAEAVKLCLEMTGAICLWSGVMELMEHCGVSAALGRFLGPVLRRLFPESASHPEILSAITENVSANLLGLGNAATPAGIRAAGGMARLSPGRTPDELCRFVLLNTASIQLIPTTLAALRGSLGAASAFDVTAALWISSSVSLLVGLAAAAVLERLWR